MSIEAMQKAAEAVHRIASANQARRIIDAPGKLTEPMLASMRAKLMTEEQIDRLCLDTFEVLVVALKDAGAAGVTMFECSPGDGESSGDTGEKP